MRPSALALALMCLFVIGGTGAAEPYLGFVTVSGDDGGDDAGPDPRVLGEALKHSGATVVRASTGESQYFPVVGRPGVGYIWGGISASTIQGYNSRGYQFFIFENEPDGTGGVNPNWAPEYMSRLNATYPTVKGVSVGNQVIGGNLFTSQYGILYDYGLRQSSDLIGFHCYSNDPATGINVGAVKSVRDTMVARGDGSAKIFLGEGWGPKRELPGLARLFPDAEPTAAEIRMLRDFVVNGYWSLITKTSSYDPAWVWGALFFTSNDNWGGRHWADRAVPHYDDDGNLTHYTVDGYNCGLDIFPHFYNGGLLDVNGNAKDNLWDVFPGKGLALANSGFELREPGNGDTVAAEWTPSGVPELSHYAVDASIRHGGRRSQRITLNGTSSESLKQVTLKSSVTAGETYGASVWVKTWRLVPGAAIGAAMKLEFLNGSGVVLGSPVWSQGVTGTSEWTLVGVTAIAPATATRLRVTCGAFGQSGRAWFDDAAAWQGASGSGTVSGYVLDDDRDPLSGAIVATTSGDFEATTNAQGFFTVSGVEPGVYDVVASKGGFAERTVKAQLVLPNRTRVLGFVLPEEKASMASGVVVTDPGVGGVLRLDWTNPTGPFDFLRIYRSDDPAQLGSVAYDNVPGPPLFDTGLQDGTRYSYTVRSVKGGVESSNTDRSYGVSSGGEQHTAYSAYPAAQWGHFGADYGQTFMAEVSGSLSSASCTPGFGGGGSTELTFSLHSGGPMGAQIGPSRTRTGAGDAECVVNWNVGEVPVESGNIYYLKITGASGFAAYRGWDVYPGGQSYMNGEVAASYDLWSTITVVQQTPLTIENVWASEEEPGRMTVRWITDVEATSSVQHGVWQEYGSLTEAGGAPVLNHAVTLTDLEPGAEYHFRVRSSRPGAPEGISLDYTFTTADASSATSVASAKAQEDGAYLAIPGVVTASFSDFLYIEDPWRASGIRVQKEAHNVPVGRALLATGVLETNEDGERVLHATHIAQGADAEVAPLMLKNEGLGGGALPGPDAIAGAVGLSNTGLLVGTFGRVTHVSDDFLYIDDGSTLNDGSGYEGLRVDLHGASPATVTGALARIVGISSCIRISGVVQRLLHLRSPADIVTLAEP